MRKKTRGLRVGVLVLMFFLILGAVSGGKTMAEAAVSFAPAVNYSTGTAPSFVATGDFNSDGPPDLAIINFGSDNISIILGSGTGTFTPEAHSPVSAGTGLQSLVVGDWDGDGALDLAVATSAGIRILLGDGAGVFSLEATTYAAGPLGTTPTFVTAGDFDRNGKLDLAVANNNGFGGGFISILIGNGDGTFVTPAPTYNASPGSVLPSFVAAGDFNRDGKLDLVTTNWSDNTISFLQGNGDGTFLTGVTYGAGGTASFSIALNIAIGDFDGDGKLDLAVANGGDDHTISILPGDGSGTFGTAVSYTTGATPRVPIIGDFNGDGKIDLATPIYYDNNVSILPGKGDGTFLMPENFGVGNTPVFAAAADFNGDGKPDLAVVNFYGNNVSILLNTTPFEPSGSLAPVSFATGTNPANLVAGDFDRDGKLDVVTANYNGGILGNISVLLGNGDNTFITPAPTYDAGTGPYGITSGDFNRDGKLDLAVANWNSNNVSILLGDGSGGFSAASGSPVSVGTGPNSIVSGDFDRDGKLDLAVANSSDGTVSILKGDGSGVFSVLGSPISVGSTPRFIVTGDFNGDSIPDLAVVNNGSDNVSILKGDGTGAFTKTDFSVGGTGTQLPYSLAIADFNRDGKPDLAIANQDGSSNTVSILLNTTPLFSATISFAAAVQYPAGSGPTGVIAVDLNRDGKLDLAVTNNSGQISLLWGKGDGTFSAPVSQIAGSLHLFIAAGDFNRDGKVDLAVTNYTGNDVSIFRNLQSISNLKINGGAAYTTSPTVTLTYDLVGTPTHIRTSTGIPNPVTGAFWSDWKTPPTSPRTLNLGANNGFREVFVQVKDIATSKISPAARASIILDTVAPAGKVKINGGATKVQSGGATTNVRLHLGMFDRNMNGAMMRIKLDATFTGDPDGLAPWEPFATGKDVVLTGTAAPPVTKKIYVQFRDGVNKVSPIYMVSINVVSTAPAWVGPPSNLTLSSFEFNGRKDYATNPAVILTYSILYTHYDNLKVRYLFAGPLGIAWTAWGTLVVVSNTVTKNLTLSSANGPRQLYVQLRDDNTDEMSDPVLASFILDTTNPGGAVWINNGAASVTRTGSNTMITLNLVGQDAPSGIDQMAVYQTGSVPAVPNDGDFIAFAPTLTDYSLNTPATGTRNVYIWFKDKAGRISARKTDSINVVP